MCVCLCSRTSEATTERVSDDKGKKELPLMLTTQIATLRTAYLKFFLTVSFSGTRYVSAL